MRAPSSGPSLRGAPWRGDFAGGAAAPLFGAVADAARLLADEPAFPSPERLDALLGPRAGVRFVAAAPRPRRRGAAERELYDRRIVVDGQVPTRVGSWHDLTNALVWATFPRAKRALHARQYALVVPARPGEVRHRPRALDALALFDEGGVVLVEGHEETVRVFGHAVLEGAVEGWPLPTASGLRVPSGCAGDLEGSGAGPEAVAALDRVLAEHLGNPGLFCDPAALVRVDLRAAIPGPPIPLTD